MDTLYGRLCLWDRPDVIWRDHVRTICPASTPLHLHLVTSRGPPCSVRPANINQTLKRGVRRGQTLQARQIDEFIGGRDRSRPGSKVSRGLRYPYMRVDLSPRLGGTHSGQSGDAENAGVETSARYKMQGWKMQEWKNRHGSAGVENAGVETSGKRLDHKSH